MHIHATAFFPQFPVYQLIVSYGQTVIVSNNNLIQLIYLRVKSLKKNVLKQSV